MRPRPFSIDSDIISSISDRFWKFVKKSDGCWLWTGAAGKGKMGYGSFNCCRRSSLAHRIAYHLAKGPIPDGLIVRHSCDNPLCINPEHLNLGTDKDNAADRDSRGRSGTVGIRNSKCKLTEDQVREIRRRYTGKWGEASPLMREFGIKAPAFYAIVRRTGWTHLKD